MPCRAAPTRKCAQVDALLAAVATGSASAALSALHIGLLRLLQADAEEAHASGALQVSVRVFLCSRVFVCFVPTKVKLSAK